MLLYQQSVAVRKYKAFPVSTPESTAEKRREEEVYSFLSSALDRGWVVNGTPWPLYFREKAPVPIIQKTVWAPATVWRGAEKRKSFAPTGV
jgi:hypothetical protein